MGVEVRRTQDGSYGSLNQNNKIEQLLIQHTIYICKSVATPLMTDFQKIEDNDKEFEDPVLY